MFVGYLVWRCFDVGDGFVYCLLICVVYSYEWYCVFTWVCYLDILTFRVEIGGLLYFDWRLKCVLACGFVSCCASVGF